MPTKESQEQISLFFSLGDLFKDEMIKNYIRKLFETILRQFILLYQTLIEKIESTENGLHFIPKSERFSR